MMWKPSASLAVLSERAKFLQAIRSFFAEQGVMEVDTPLLSQSTVTAPHLQSFAILCENAKQARYLQTSPEYAMKRLLASGSGPIYYLGKAFRQEEVGSRHNPEFTMLEWYRPQWDHWQLIAEVDALFQRLLNCPPAEMVSYQALFEQHLGIHPHVASVNALKAVAVEREWIQPHPSFDLDRDGWLDLLITHGIEPYLGQTHPIVVVDFPASQASLAKTRQVDSFAVAERFEFYYRGFELANGYHELSCANELEIRFEEDLFKRKALGLSEMPIDHYLLDALKSGLPACAGVAVGVDRLLMLKLNQSKIADVLPFNWERA
ncbi:MAG: EF-P lysine aminoacylase GenX [Gammaproteobacteria bacterium 39-13]|nr:elongation factor P--(R)-beta-lysine ligase [Gammaproteobacteria bacterium]OJV90398.1 MAG: EF-P lysine aminoacylase GenX [Gammaproteobacteria bacterium 39-13]